MLDLQPFARLLFFEEKIKKRKRSATITVKQWSMLSLPISSSGSTRDVE